MSKESIEYKIEHAIRTTLVVLNKQSIDIAVEKIKVIIDEYNKDNLSRTKSRTKCPR